MGVKSSQRKWDNMKKVCFVYKRNPTNPNAQKHKKAQRELTHKSKHHNLNVKKGFSSYDIEIHSQIIIYFILFILLQAIFFYLTYL